ncbi:hypothetical protein CISIN_1g043714mg [Citrus sinensis]|uniref:Uncharacterized protein n=1 Tax=Citrus sinensis TaxID=2711 RepID=A0A067DEP2_CITSI|nr:hypothetical protein CISIN_1g043714mg [Citrus sinensis]
MFHEESLLRSMCWTFSVYCIIGLHPVRTSELLGWRVSFCYSKLVLVWVCGICVSAYYVMSLFFLIIN